MGKHKGTADGSGFDSLTPQEKAEEFDKSHANPAAYAQENFTNGGGNPVAGEYAYGDGSRHQEYRDENDELNRRGK